MKIAVQGCCHGSLAAIYDSISRYESLKSTTVDLLLLCGDFQALRSSHDFASLAVPPKYHALGTFHNYYSGRTVAPVLTLVIGGNHEASNYMSELYHGGWLAPNIYYLGAAGSVLVDGLRIVGASGIYKDHDYGKGHFETVPYDKSTLRSVYHIRGYDVAKLMQLPRFEPTVFLSHDWPTTIAKHGDLNALLRRKPFFRDEINSNTLGSPPLYTLLKHIQPAYWFAAHLHVKFAALYKHTSTNGTLSSSTQGPLPTSESAYLTGLQSQTIDQNNPVDNENPDEISISDDEDEEDHHYIHVEGTAAALQSSIIDRSRVEVSAALSGGTVADAVAAVNPDEITLSDEEDDIAQPDVRPDVGSSSAIMPIAVGEVKAAGEGSRTTRFLALDKCGPGKDFIQFLDISAPNPSPTGQPRLSFDPHWLAITRAFHPYLSTTIRQTPLPPPWELEKLVQRELERIRTEGLLVPAELSLKDLESGRAASRGENGAGEDKDEGDGRGEDYPTLVWEKGDVDIGRVQQFWPTAPAEGQPGGSPSAWYTNPQTEAFCGMLGIANKINPAPAAQ